MSVSGAVWGLVTANSGVQAVISTRLYPLVAPQDVALPCAVYEQSGTSPVETLGPSAPGQFEARFSLTAWGDTYREARGAGEAIAAALYRAIGTYDSTRILGTRVESLSDGYDAETQRYSTTVETTVVHT